MGGAHCQLGQCNAPATGGPTTGASPIATGAELASGDAQRVSLV